MSYNRIDMVNRIFINDTRRSYGTISFSYGSIWHYFIYESVNLCNTMCQMKHKRLLTRNKTLNHI